jgi:hypothetical protein
MPQGVRCEASDRPSHIVHHCSPSSECEAALRRLELAQVFEHNFIDWDAGMRFEIDSMPVFSSFR